MNVYNVYDIVCIGVSNFFDKTVQLHKKHNKFLWRWINFETFILRRAIACLILYMRIRSTIYTTFKRNNKRRILPVFFSVRNFKEKEMISFYLTRFIKKEIRLLLLLYTPTNIHRYTIYL